MYRSALVALNVEGGNEPVVQAAIDLAARHQFFLMGVAVVDASSVRPTESVPVMGDSFRVRRNDALMTQAHERAQMEVADFARRCAERDIPCDTEVRDGSLGEEVSMAVRATDLLIVGHGGDSESCSPAREDVSQLDAMLKDSVQPGLVIPCSSPIPELVVVAYDGSAQAGRALHEFGISGLWQDSRVEVLSIGSDVSEVNETANRAAAYLRLHGYAADAKPIVAKYDTVNLILDYINDSGAGALVMGSYGKPRWREFVFGTVTKGILRAAMVPIFLAQ